MIGPWTALGSPNYVRPSGVLRRGDKSGGTASGSCHRLVCLQILGSPRFNNTRVNRVLRTGESWIGMSFHSPCATSSGTCWSRCFWLPAVFGSCCVGRTESFGTCCFGELGVSTRPWAFLGGLFGTMAGVTGFFDFLRLLRVGRLAVAISVAGRGMGFAFVMAQGRYLQKGRLRGSQKL